MESDSGPRVQRGTKGLEDARGWGGRHCLEGPVVSRVWAQVETDSGPLESECP